MNLNNKQLNILKKYFNNKTILVTGGTGSFGKICIKEMRNYLEACFCRPEIYGNQICL